MLVLDPLRDISSAAEDKSDEMSQVMRRLRLLGELLGCTVAIVHHSGKPSENTSKRGGGQRLRGSGAIHGSTDSGIYFLECAGDGTNVFHNTVESEIKGARSAGTFELELRITDNENGEATSATWSVTREATVSKVDTDTVAQLVTTIADTMLATDGRRGTHSALRKKLGGTKGDFTIAFKSMESEGLIKAVKRGKRHEGFELTPAGVRFAQGVIAEDRRVPD